jgi:hypothetical protein
VLLKCCADLFFFFDASKDAPNLWQEYFRAQTCPHERTEKIDVEFHLQSKVQTAHLIRIVYHPRKLRMPGPPHQTLAACFPRALSQAGCPGWPVRKPTKRGDTPLPAGACSVRPPSLPRHARGDSISISAGGRDRLICYVLAELFGLGRPPSPSLTARISRTPASSASTASGSAWSFPRLAACSSEEILYSCFGGISQWQQHQGAMHATAIRKGSEDRVRSEMFFFTGARGFVG